ncbi:GNAT family N-acetyltransferase [Nocardioides sp. YIM 152315]|uniref:GNAT family N-acetyltransferase n=1 Tax=Nocardioides sp. YIM 152315 TaxID=3031760 RepID=UPI0023DC07D0|nr:GNAT family N-acetyltransferase [Nocardioides sp. YIM 152315]MDF1602023.1 GNAT family N-acetyltransferase [Nocardioides sp. YIM 152315]
MSRIIQTPRLVLRPWEATDVDAAFAIFSAPSVREWVPPELGPPDTVEGMRALLASWADRDSLSEKALGHWAVGRRGSSAVIGGLTLHPASVGGESIALAWALSPSAWGHGYAAEAGDALVRWAIHDMGEIEIFALVQPDNKRAAATAERIGMEWVTEIGHVDNGRYQVYRIRHGDLDWEE